MPSKLWRGYHSIAYLPKSFKIYHSGNALERSRPLKGYGSSSVLLEQTLWNPKRKKVKRDWSSLVGQWFRFCLPLLALRAQFFLPRGQRTLFSSKLPSDVNSRRIIRLQNPSIN